MKKNSITATILSTVFILTSVGMYNITQKKYNDPELLKELVEITPATAEGSKKIVKQEDPLKKLINQCKVCHIFKNNGKNKTGPNLFDVYMRKIASNDKFKYSNAFKNANIVWNDENLDQFLTKPNDFMPKTKMAFNGLSNPEDRKLVIDYLKTLK